MVKQESFCKIQQKNNFMISSTGRLTRIPFLGGGSPALVSGTKYEKKGPHLISTNSPSFRHPDFSLSKLHKIYSSPNMSKSPKLEMP